VCVCVCVVCGVCVCVCMRAVCVVRGARQWDIL
jgi:hypothetical protein